MRVKDLRAAARQSLRSAAVSPRKLTLLFLLCLYGVNALLIVMDLCAERLIGDGSGNDDAIIERAARDDLGYARPSERIFYDISGK